MNKVTDRYFPLSVSRLAIAALIAGVSLAYPAHAAQDIPTVENAVAAPAAAADDTQSSSGETMKHEGLKHVDERINTLHDKLNLDHAQESKWNKVAAVMRQNEEAMRKQVDARHQAESASAVDDLKSYERIVSAHETGLKKLIPVFQNFYNSLSTEQKANADQVFREYEGHEENKTGEAVPPGNAPDITPAAGGENNNLAPAPSYAPSANTPNNAAPNAPANTNPAGPAAPASPTAPAPGAGTNPVQ